MRRGLHPAALLATAAFVLAACGGTSPEASTPASSDDAGQEAMADDDGADEMTDGMDADASDEMTDGDHDESADGATADDSMDSADDGDGDGGMDGDGEAAAANAAALDFTARALQGGTVNGQDYAGGDVVLWMWTSWCPNCNNEAPGVKEAVERYGDQVTFIGVPGADDDDEGRMDFVARHELSSIPHAVDDDGSLWAQYGVGYQPAWIFIDEDGDVERVAGGLYDELDERVEALIAG